MSDHNRAAKRSRETDGSAHAPRPTIRKHTYAARKEESDRLSEQAYALSAQVEELRRKRQDETTSTKASQNADMRCVIESQKQVLWGAHALLFDWMNMPFESPLSTFIHLTSDFHERRQTVLCMKPMKLQMAERFLCLHSQQLDLLRPHVTESHMENTQGDYFATWVEVEQFEGAQSVKEVFDALLYSAANFEIAGANTLGHIIVRDDVDTIDGGVWNSRLVFKGANGTQCESNCVTFTQFQGDHVFSGCEAPGVGLFVTDFVDKDDLYPYEPSHNVRRDVSIVCMLTPHWQLTAQRSSEPRAAAMRTTREFVVVLQHIVFEKIHRSDLPIDQPALRALRQGTKGWAEVVVDGMHERLAATRARADAAQRLLM